VYSKVYSPILDDSRPDNRKAGMFETWSADGLYTAKGRQDDAIASHKPAVKLVGALSSMATDRQIAANRANARKSTGPRAAEGRSLAAQNARRHGLSSVPQDLDLAFQERSLRLAKSILRRMETSLRASLRIRSSAGLPQAHRERPRPHHGRLELGRAQH
jgi:hypothetical protein